MNWRTTGANWRPPVTRSTRFPASPPVPYKGLATGVAEIGAAKNNIRNPPEREEGTPPLLDVYMFAHTPRGYGLVSALELGLEQTRSHFAMPASIAVQRISHPPHTVARPAERRCNIKGLAASMVHLATLWPVLPTTRPTDRLRYSAATGQRKAASDRRNRWRELGKRPGVATPAIGLGLARLISTSQVLIGGAFLALCPEKAAMFVG